MPTIEYRINSDDDLLVFLNLKEDFYQRIDVINLSFYELDKLEAAVFKKFIDCLSSCQHLKSINLSLTGFWKMAQERYTKLFDALSVSDRLSSLDISCNYGIFSDSATQDLFCSQIKKLQHLITIKGPVSQDISSVLEENFNAIEKFKSDLMDKIKESNIIPIPGIRQIIVSYVPPLVFSETKPRPTESRERISCFNLFVGRVGKMLGY